MGVSMIGALMYWFLYIYELYYIHAYRLCAGTAEKHTGNALKVYYNIIECYSICRRARHYLFTRYTLNTCFLTYPMVRSTTRYVSTGTNPHTSFIV